MQRTLKAGCVILSQQDKNKVALIYQHKYKDISFPKGHLENGETLEECAIRETKEETGLDIEIISQLEPAIFYTSNREECELILFLAVCLDDSQVNPEKGIEVLWTPLNEVAQKLTYQNQKDFFQKSLQKEVKVV